MSNMERTLSPLAAEVGGVGTEAEGVPTSASSIVDKCLQLDEGLAAAFIRGDIRLLRRAWVLEAPDQHLPYRQVLEERERRGELPLLSPEEAAALLECGDRSIGALTHPWYSPGDPDPVGVKLKILREALLVLTHIEAIFVDYASLFQHPPKGTRTEAENEAFKRALGVMGDVYASAVGTTVLQIKEIPPRPQEFDGELCLFGLKAGVDEAAVCQALSDLSTEFESCDLAFESTYGVVRFTTHAAALRAKAANTFSELCGGVDTRYNERSYDGRGDGEGGRDGDEGRGWCCFEGGVSGELLVRLSVYPRMKAELDKLPPKLISLASGRAPEPVELSHSDVWQRVQQVVESIEKATFTGKGDKEVVPVLYKGYVERVATVLASTLALQTTLETSAEVPPIPLVDAPPADALRLADGQLLLLLPGAGARLAGGDGAWLAEVASSAPCAISLMTVWRN
uniref:Uncharacterized protein n=1 Tax=Emiliania huxleyi TaxID=2903 RepID=A0A7S3T6I3_EMIHU